MGQGTPKEAFAGELPSTAAAEEALEEETNKEEEEAMQALSVIDTKKRQVIHGRQLSSAGACPAGASPVTGSARGDSRPASCAGHELD